MSFLNPALINQTIMRKILRSKSLLVTGIIFITSCSPRLNKDSYNGSVNTSGYQADSLAAPYETKSIQNFSKVVGWKKDEAPVAPPGFTVVGGGDFNKPAFPGEFDRKLYNGS